MLHRLFHFYQRKRVVNINVNIVTAGMLAVLLTLIPVNLSRNFLAGDTTREMVYITIIAGVSDMVFDVLIYYLLHWVANHWRPFRPSTPKAQAMYQQKPPPFFKDATLIQFERALLSPLYYAVALGLKLWLLHLGLEREWALIIGFACGLVVTRTVHTFWGLRSGTMRDLS